MKVPFQWALAGLGLFSKLAGALDVNFDDEESVKEAAATAAYGLVKYYTGNNTGDVPGNLPDPYYWWIAGAMFGALIDYWSYTGDTSYNAITLQAMVHQAGIDVDFMPENQTLTEGNDDQGFWVMAAMSAAELKFPDPPSDQPQWLALSQSVLNQYASRWDTAICEGGLRWQIFTFNAGFDYKNSISNGCFFNVAARLARYTGNDTYADWADTVWDWIEFVGLITPEWGIYDGAGVRRGDNCTEIDQVQWTYNAGIFLHGAAVMYNYTESDVWKDRTQQMFDHLKVKFFRDNVVYEVQCEDSKTCNVDQSSFKGYLLRWLAASSQMAPFIADEARGLILSSARAAATVCTGSPAVGFKGHPGTACGFAWTGNPGFDGTVGVGEQMNAMSAFMYTLGGAPAPVTAMSGGTSVGNVGGGSSIKNIGQLSEITTGDRVAAGFLTTAVLVSVVAGCAFIIR
jgi:mannan endo-1,6-alpha-mannosidase